MFHTTTTLAADAFANDEHHITVLKGEKRALELVLSGGSLLDAIRCIEETAEAALATCSEPELPNVRAQLVVHSHSQERSASGKLAAAKPRSDPAAVHAVPLFASSGAELGRLEVWHSGGGPLNVRESAALAALGRTAAMVIEHLRPASSDRPAASPAPSACLQPAVLAQVAQASKAISAARSVHEIARLLTLHVREIVGAQRASTSIAIEGLCLREHAPPEPVEPQAGRLIARAHRTTTSTATLGAFDALAVPLRGQNAEALGQVELVSKVGEVFRAQDEALVVQLAALASVGIDNCRLYASLQASNERVKVAADGGGLGLFTWDVTADTPVWHNTQLYTIFGMEPNAPPVDSASFVADVLHPDDVQDFQTAVHQAVTAGDGLAVQVRIYRVSDRELRWLEIKGMVQADHRPSTLIVGTVADITQRKHDEQQLREREERLQQLANTIPNLAWMADADGFITWYNDRWYDYTGTTFAQMQGWGWQSVHDPLVLPEVMRRWPQALRTGAPFEMTFPLRGRDGVFRPFFTRVAPLRDSCGTIVQWFGTNTDVSTLKKAEDELRDADRRKDEFIAMLAHELRNPLAPIKNCAELLLRLNSADPRVTRFGEIIGRQSSHMSCLLDGLLDVSRITRGLVTVEKNPVQLRAVIDSAVEQVRPLVDAKEQDLQVRLGECTPSVCGSPTRLTQVMVNLLENAAKYSQPRSTIEVQVSHGPTQAVIEVIDSGPGIPADLLPRIFEPFTQAERGLERGNGGLGLGLAIVKGLVELHGGSVRVYSDDALPGSRFEVRLPLMSGEPEADTAPVVRLAGQHPLDALDVLVVDDNSDAADSLASLLDSAGHRPRVAYAGHEALTLAQDVRFDVAILDIGLPDISGFDLARRLRHLPHGAPALYSLSGYGQERDRAQALAAGFVRHLVKPVRPAELLDLLRRSDVSATSPHRDGQPSADER